MWLLGISSALAGSGPWTVGASRSSVFVGLEGQRLGKLAIDRGDDRQVLDVGEGLQRLTVKGLATVGLSNRVDLEFSVPWSRVEATRPDAALCVALGLGACDTTQGIGIVEARGKVLLLDEYFNAPLSVAIGGEVRLGQLTADDRERITNLGEGTIDFGPSLSVGRTAGLGTEGYLSAWVQGGYRFRTRNTNEYPLADPKRDLSAPKDELTLAAEVLVAPTGKWAVGPEVLFLQRSGLDFSELDLADPDRFAALAITSLRVGGTAVVKASNTIAGTLTVLGTAVAVNNPTDTWLVSTGIQWNGDLPGGEG